MRMIESTEDRAFRDEVRSWLADHVPRERRPRKRKPREQQWQLNVAMVLGTLGGALIGNEVQKKHDRPVVGQQVSFAPAMACWSRSCSLRAPICGSDSGSTSKETGTAPG